MPSFVAGARATAARLPFGAHAACASHLGYYEVGCTGVFRPPRRPDSLDAKRPFPQRERSSTAHANNRRRTFHLAGIMNIKRIKRSVLIGVLAAATGLSAPAFAGPHGGGYYHGGGYHGGGWHGGGWGGWGWGLGLGLGLGYTAAVVSSSYYYPPSYYYPATTYYYPAPTYYAPAPAPVYQAAPVQTSAAPPPPSQASSDWYYCRSTQAYYPNVRTCNVPWQQVPATPPGRIN